MNAVAIKLFRSMIILSMLGVFLGVPRSVQAQATTGSISGIVVDADLNALGSIPVTVVSLYGDYFDATCSDTQGNYAFTDLPFDTYAVEAAGNGFDCGVEFPYAREYWNDQPMGNTATPVELKETQPDIPYIDFTLGPGGTLRGKVLDVNGNQIAGGRISIALNLEDYSFPTELYTCSWYDGTYEIKHIPLGVAYKLSAAVFPCPDNLSGYGTIYAWPDSPTKSGGEILTPTVSEPVLENKNFTLHELGSTPTGSEVLTFTSNGFITFESVSSSGTTTVETIITDPPPNFQTLGEYYELSTSANFSNAQVCFNYDDDGLSLSEESAIRLLHKENFVWVDVTDSGYPNTTADVVCGTVASFSPFVLALPTYNFSGFLQPVDNLPTLNLVKAGSVVPVKFSLGSDWGLNIFDTGYPRSQVIACDSVAPVDGIEETMAAGSNGLSYDAGTNKYIYGWKTDKAWANTCRQLVIKFNDGTVHRANFKFK